MIFDPALLLRIARPDDYRPRLGTHPASPGWVTDACFLAYVGAGNEPPGCGLWWTNPPYDDPARPGPIAELLITMAKAVRVPVREIEDLRIADAIVPCSDCRGRKKRRERDDDGSVFYVECEWCGGTGDTLRNGQVVYMDPSGNRTVIAPKYRQLFDGLATCRMSNGEPAARSAIAGFPIDDLRSTAMIVVVMPVDADIRQPIACPKCKRRFTTESGLGQHFRHAKRIGRCAR